MCCYLTVYEYTDDWHGLQEYLPKRQGIRSSSKSKERESESFSDIVLRLLGPDDDISDLFGVLSMSDEERENLFEDLDEIWGAWLH